MAKLAAKTKLASKAGMPTPTATKPVASQPLLVPGVNTGASGIAWSRRQRFNPIRALQPSTLAQTLEQFEHGHLAHAASLFEAIAERDDTIKGVKSKRELSIAQLPWAVLTLDDSPEALQHQAALEFFWNNLTATSVYDRNIRGGFSRFVRQLMGAVSFRYAAHHVVWQPVDREIEVKDKEGDVLTTLPGFTATFEHVPLNFFENITGALRFLETGIGIEGKDLDPGEWLVTVGDGLMVACSICYLFKRMSLQDWVNFNEKFGMPGVHVETNAAKDSPEWDAIVAAASQFMNDFAAVTSQGTKFNLVQAGGGGQAEFAQLVERMDRVMASLYRGADLSTLSAGIGQGDGASLQGEESQLLERGDAEMVTEALNQIDRLVLQWHFGTDRGLAYTRVTPATEQDGKRDLEIVTGLVNLGLPVPQNWAREKFSIPAPTDDDELLRPTPQPGAVGIRAADDVKDPAMAGNIRTKSDPRLEQLMAAGRQGVAKSMAADVAPLRTALAAVLQGDDAELPARLKALNAAMPALLRRVIAGEFKSGTALNQAVATAAAGGLSLTKPASAAQ